MVEQSDENSRAQTYLQPVAAPSILGLYGFAGATLILASHTAGWWGNFQSTAYIWPFASAFGGIAEFVGSATGSGWAPLAGWTFVVSAVCAFYTGSALMFEGVWGRSVLPVGMTRHAEGQPDIAVGVGEPGIQKG